MAKKVLPRTPVEGEKPRKRTRIPWERKETRKIYNWCLKYFEKYPVLRLMFHPANEKARFLGPEDFIVAGVPDLWLPCARKGFHGLVIELKAQKGKATQEQVAYIEALERQGYWATVAVGALEAIALLRFYLDIEELPY